MLFALLFANLKSRAIEKGWLNGRIYLKPSEHSEKSTVPGAYIVSCRGASQLGGSLQGIPQGYKANKLKSH